MAGGTFQKRQKEWKRREKQQLKATKRAEKKMEKNAAAQDRPESAPEDLSTVQPSTDENAVVDDSAAALIPAK